MVVVLLWCSGLEVAGGKNVRIKKLGWVLYPGKQNPPENFVGEKERYLALRSSRSSIDAQIGVYSQINPCLACITLKAVSDSYIIFRVPTLKRK